MNIFNQWVRNEFYTSQFFFYLYLPVDLVWQRSRSLPDIQFGETLLEELGIDRSIKKDVLAQYEIDILKRQMAQQKLQVMIQLPSVTIWML